MAKRTLFVFLPLAGFFFLKQQATDIVRASTKFPDHYSAVASLFVPDQTTCGILLRIIHCTIPKPRHRTTHFSQATRLPSPMSDHQRFPTELPFLLKSSGIPKDTNKHSCLPPKNKSDASKPVSQQCVKGTALHISSPTLSLQKIVMHKIYACIAHDSVLRCEHNASCGEQGCSFPEPQPHVHDRQFVRL